jgi:hypothetical protein
MKTYLYYALTDWEEYRISFHLSGSRCYMDSRPGILISFGAALVLWSFSVLIHFPVASTPRK